MNCYLHPNAPAVAYCRSCGRALCAVCQKPAEGTVFCVDHLPAPATAAGAAAGPNPYTAPPPPPSSGDAAATNTMRVSPALAFLLGWIPGVGAIYNGQYVKGLIHAFIFGMLVTLDNSLRTDEGQPVAGILTAAFLFYMAFEAYHTARKRQMGRPLDEWSSLLGPNRLSTAFPIGPVALIVIGVLFLLQTLHIFDLRIIGHFWPVILIVIGVVMLSSRIRRPAPPPYVDYPSLPARPASMVESSRE